MWSLCVCACVCTLLALCEAACPTNCQCSGTEIRCIFHKVPQDIPLDTTILYLSHNFIKELPPDVFKGLANLKNLYLKRNLLTSLESGVFHGLTALTHLRLLNNQLTSLESGVFHGLTALTHLNLNYNQIKELPPDIFKGLERLNTLYLSHNKIKELPPDIFKGLANLEILYLSHNKIKELPPDIFKGLANLEILSLADNQLTIIETGVFRDLSALQTLALERNTIKELQPDCFKGLDHLEQLNLNYNQINELPPDIFKGLERLNILYLSHNKIKELPPDIFKGLANLKILSLADNHLTIIETGVFRDLSALQTFCLEHNPFVCDCTMKPTKKFLEDKRSCEKTTCQFPSNLAGKYLEDIPDDNFICSKPYFLQTPQDTNSNVGDTVILNCSAVGLPQPDISWSKDNSQVQSGGEIQITRSGSLVISNSVRHYAGTYRCTATNSEGNISAVAQFKVYKMCPALESDSLSLQCKYGLTKVVDCSKPMLPQTTVTFNCKPNYVEYPDLAKDGAYSKTLTCLQYKRWSSSLPLCKPGCGVSKIDSIIDIRLLDGTETTPGDYPWHAGLYVVKGNRTDYICGGSLISNRIVMTAAHCAEEKVEDLRVALGKFYRSWTHEEPYTVRRNVSDKKLPEEYKGPLTAYAWDIALLVLSQEVQTDSFIMPVCRDASFAPEQSINTTALMAGWGNTEKGTTSETLLSTILTVLGRKACHKRLGALSFDKICGSKDAGHVAGKGDSGGGLTVLHNGLHYIIGVVSVSYNEVTTFTDISKWYHNTWIENQTKEIENHFGSL